VIAKNTKKKMTKASKSIKNYTTEIDVEKTMLEIEKILAKYGASHIFKMYDREGNPKALAFKRQIQDQIIAFKLPMEEEKILQVFREDYNSRKIEKKYVNLDQARRTGWRIVKDWVDAQMSLVRIHLVKFEEVFLPYMYDEKRDETLFQMMEKKQFRLEDKR
jgi:hypothetical protein